MTPLEKGVIECKLEGLSEVAATFCVIAAFESGDGALHRLLCRQMGQQKGIASKFRVRQDYHLQLRPVR